MGVGIYLNQFLIKCAKVQKLWQLYLRSAAIELPWVENKIGFRNRFPLIRRAFKKNLLDKSEIPRFEIVCLVANSYSGLMEVITERKIKPIVIKIPEGFEYFNYEDIIRFEARGNCTLVFSTRSEKPSKSLCNLLTIEKKFPHHSFLRCHKSHIINLTHVRKICIKIRKIIMEGEIAIPVSENCLRDLKEMSNHSSF